MLRSTHPRSAGGAEQVQGGTSVNADTVQTWLETAAASLHEQRDYLTQLDAAIGDADHGTNMDRGFTAVVGKLDGLAGPPRTSAHSTLPTHSTPHWKASSSSARRRRATRQWSTRSRRQCARCDRSSIRG